MTIYYSYLFSAWWEYNITIFSMKVFKYVQWKIQIYFQHGGLLWFRHLSSNTCHRPEAGSGTIFILVQLYSMYNMAVFVVGIYSSSPTSKKPNKLKLWPADTLTHVPTLFVLPILQFLVLDKRCEIGRVNKIQSVSFLLFKNWQKLSLKSYTLLIYPFVNGLGCIFLLIQIHDVYYTCVELCAIDLLLLTVDT